VRGWEPITCLRKPNLREPERRRGTHVAEASWLLVWWLELAVLHAPSHTSVPTTPARTYAHSRGACYLQDRAVSGGTGGLKAAHGAGLVVACAGGLSTCLHSSRPFIVHHHAPLSPPPRPPIARAQCCDTCYLHTRAASGGTAVCRPVRGPGWWWCTQVGWGGPATQSPEPPSHRAPHTSVCTHPAQPYTHSRDPCWHPAGAGSGGIGDVHEGHGPMFVVARTQGGLG
jgi:hypothetical protein